MKHILGLALLAALAAAPVAVEAQTPQPQQRHDQAARAKGMAPIARILEQREQLGLTAAQVAQLEAIGQQLREQNAPLMEQIRASGAWQRGDRAERGDRGPRGERQRDARAEHAPRGEGERGMRGQRQLPEELRPVMQQMRENHRSALEQVRSVLTDEQQAQLREHAQQRRSEMQRRGGVRGQRGPGGTR